MDSLNQYFDYGNKEGCERALIFYKGMVEKYEDVINHFETTMKHFRFPERRFRTQELKDSYGNVNSFKEKVKELTLMIKNEEYERN